MNTTAGNGDMNVLMGQPLRSRWVNNVRRDLGFKGMWKKRVEDTTDREGWLLK